MISKSGVGWLIYKAGVVVKQALSAASETVAKGLYNATTLSTVDADLAPANIKDTVNIFGKVGTVVAGGVETYEEYSYASLGIGAIYTPTDPGLFSAALDRRTLRANLYYGTDVLVGTVRGIGAIVGDGTYLDFKNESATSAYYLAVMRHYISTGTYEEYYHSDIAANTTYTPADEGLFSQAPEVAYPVSIHFRYHTKEWHIYTDEGTERGNTLGIGDGSQLTIKNVTGGALRTNLMRATMT